MQLTNEWIRFIYRLWAPIYDATVNRAFMPGRRRALEVLALQPGERVLMVGVGTGEDLLLLPAGVTALGIDISPEMLAQARSKLPRCKASVQLVEGDAQLPFTGGAVFDAAILNLILSVIPDAHVCLQTTMRALKPGGRAVVFDKLLLGGTSASSMRKLLNFFSTLFGTDINRRLSEMAQGCPCDELSNEPSIGDGLYRVVLLRKHGCV